MENIISMKNVQKNFGKVTALKNLSFDVKKGEIFGFLGPSGAGKTTTIKILTSQLMPSGGEVNVFGKNIYVGKNNNYSDIGILTDNSGIYERLSVEDNLLLFAEINGISKGSVDDALEKVGMLDSKKKAAKKLSKGMKQRVMLARATLHQPKLLFLDEPTAALDPGTTLEIHRLLRKINEEGTTIFLTTHNMEEADKLCDRVAFLNDGEIVDSGNPEVLKLKYTDNNIRVLLKQQQEPAIIKNDSAGAAKIKLWMEQGQVLSIHSMEPSLEKIFLRLTGREL